MKLLVIIAVLVLVFAAQASAAPTPMSLAFTPAPAYVGDHVYYSGCGFQPGHDIAVFVTPPGAQTYSAQLYARIRPDGCFDTATDFQTPWYYVPPAAGMYAVSVYPKTGSGVGIYGNHKEIYSQCYEVFAR